MGASDRQEVCNVGDRLGVWWSRALGRVGKNVVLLSPLLLGSVAIPSSCCMSFISKKIPEGRVVGYQVSNGSVCPKAGVIFTTKKGQKFCGDPKQLWVQRYMKNLEARRKKASPGDKAIGRKAPVRRHPANSTTI
nr:C-C motif chemokine 24 isoform X1 [Loxodonta africana]